jgi:hypothetical protein
LEEFYLAIAGEGALWQARATGPTFTYLDNFVLSVGYQGDMRDCVCRLSTRGFNIPADENGACRLTGTLSGESFQLDEIEVWKYTGHQ